MAEIPKVRRNLERMISKGASDAEINEYLTLEGITEGEIRAEGRRQNRAVRQLSVNEQIARLREEGFDPESGMSIDMFRFVSDQPRTVDRLFGRPAFEGAGATAAGVPAAVLRGGRAGSVAGLAGAATGTALFNIARAAEDVIDFPSVRGVSPAGVGEALGKQGRDIAGALGFEAGGQTAVGLLQRGAHPGLMLAGKALGMGERAAQRTAGLLRSETIPFGPVDLGTSAAQTVFKPLAVMPLIASKAKEAMNRKLVRISERYLGLLDEVAEAHSLPVLGGKIGEATRSRFNAARVGVARLYVDMYDTFARIGNPRVVPTAPMKTRAKELLGRLDELPREQKLVTRDTGIVDEFGKTITRKEVEAGKRVGEFASGDSVFREQLERFLLLDEFITPVEFRALQKSMNRAIRLRKGATGAEVEFGMLTQMQRAGSQSLEGIDLGMLEQALRDIDTALDPAEQAVQIIGKIKNANTGWAQLMNRISTPAAKRLAKADPGLFRSGNFNRGGTIDVDQLANDLIGAQSTLRSPDFIASLDDLIGVENRQKLARAVLAKAASVSVVEDVSLGVVKTLGKRRLGRFGRREVTKTEELRDIVVLDPQAMENALGIGMVSDLVGGGATKTNKDALKALLKGTGVEVQTLVTFLKAVKKAQAAGAANPSVFLTRRLMLTGKFTLPGAGVAPPTDAGFVARLVGKAFDVGGLIIGGRFAVKMLTTEKGLRLLTEGMKINTNRQELFRWIVRVGKAFPDDGITIKELPLEKQEQVLSREAGGDDERPAAARRRPTTVRPNFDFLPEPSTRSRPPSSSRPQQPSQLRLRPARPPRLSGGLGL